MASTVDAKPITGRHVLLLLIAFFGVIVGVNLTLAYFANSTWSGLVVQNGYVASQSFGTDLARAKAQEALGWTVAMSHSNDRVRLTFVDANDNKLSGLALSGTLRRPASERFDQSLTFSSSGAGVYSAPAELSPGVWEIQVGASGDGVDDYKKTFRFVVKD